MLTEYFFACTFLLKQIATSVRRAATHAQLMKCVRTRLDLTLALVFLGTLERQETVKVIHRCNLFLNTPDLFLPFNCCSFTDPSSEMTINTTKVWLDRKILSSIFPNLHLILKFIIFLFTSIADLDECVNPETNECDSNAVCTNTEGSHVCRCQSGYQGDGRNCTGKYSGNDEDFWRIFGKHFSSKDHSCASLHRMKLILYHVYRFSSTLDFDECASNETNDCHGNALCNNTDGSYICRCLSGYQGDGKNCTGKYLVYWLQMRSNIHSSKL